MTYSEARAAIYGRLDAGMQANHPGVEVRYENRLQVDLATQVAPFVACQVLWNAGEQVSIEATPKVRYRGAIWLSVHVKEGAGTDTALALLDYLQALFRVTRFGGVVTQAPVPVPAYPSQGWYVETLRVPFWIES